jgi:uncharacterized membrane protein YqjE
METVLSLLPKLAPLVVRHLAAYVELAADDATALARLLTQRLVAAAVALLGTIFALLMGCLWIVTAVWDTSWRGPTIGALLVIFAAVAVVGAVIAMRRWSVDQKPFLRLRSEWDNDQSLIGELSEPEAGS